MNEVLITSSVLIVALLILRILFAKKWVEHGSMPHGYW